MNEPSRSSPSDRLSSSSIATAPPPARPGASPVAPQSRAGGGRRSAALLLAALALLLFPFSGKPLYIDDWVYLAVAERLAGAPLDPYHGDGRYLGEVVSVMEGMPHPPLWPYLLAPTLPGSGDHDAPIGAHLLNFGFLLAAAAAAHRLATRFTARPALAAGLVALSPAYFVTATHLSNDVCAAALSLWALALFIHGVDAERRGPLVASGVVFGLALLTRYSTASLLPVFFLYALLRRASLTRAALPVAIGFLVLSPWFAQNLLLYGSIHPLMATAYAPPQGLRDVLLRGPASVSFLGGAALFPPLLALLAWNRNGARNRRLAGALAGAAAGLFLVFALGALDGYSFADLGALALFFSLGFGALLSALSAPSRAVRALRAPGSPEEADAVFLAAWILIVLLSQAILLPMVNARYLMPVVAPLVFLLLRRKEVLDRLAGLRAAGALAAAALFALTLSAVDLAAARSFPRFVRRIATSSPGDGRVYYDGGRGELDHYMRESGAGIYLLRDDLSPRPGDRVIRTNRPADLPLHPELELRLSFEGRLESASPIPLRLFQYRARAGFYSHAWGLLPYDLSRLPLEWVDVHRVHHLIAGQGASDHAVGEIGPRNEIAQTFTGDGRAVTSVKVLLATYARRNASPLLFEIASGEGEVVHRETLAADRIEDNRWIEIAVPPTETVPGRRYRLSLRAPAARPGDAVTAWASSRDLYRGGRLLRNGAPAEGDLAFAVLSAPQEP